MPSENEMSLRHHPAPALDKWERFVLLWLGTAVLRRAALEENKRLFRHQPSRRIAKPPSSSISRGWNSVYVDKPLIAGLQPATFASFIGQRRRWAQGMMQILRFRFPLLKGVA